MARYRGSTWDPLGPQTEPRMQAHDIVCLHTMVGTLAGTSSMFHQNGYGGTESHWGMGHDGKTLQWQDIGFEADANYNSNHRVLSMETADKGPGFPVWSGSDVPAWTPAQVDKLVDWLLWVTSKEAHRDCPADWLCHVAGIPRVLIPDTRPGRRGIGYHRQGVDSYPELYKPGWRQPGGELWSGSRGKVCPGDRRIQQLVTVIIPRVQQATTQPLEDDMGLTDEDRAWFGEQLGKQASVIVTGNGNTLANPGLKGWGWLNEPHASLASLAAAVGVDEAEIARQVVTAMPVDQLADAIAAKLPGEQQNALLDALAARLAG